MPASLQSHWERRQQAWEQRRQAWEHPRQAWEHLGAPGINVGALATCLGAHRITGEQSGKNNNFFGIADGAPGNNTYYLLFNDC
jgi:hypothetical protein